MNILKFECPFVTYQNGEKIPITSQAYGFRIRKRKLSKLNAVCEKLFKTRKFELKHAKTLKLLEKCLIQVAAIDLPVATKYFCEILNVCYF